MDEMTESLKKNIRKELAKIKVSFFKEKILKERIISELKIMDFFILLFIIYYFRLRVRGQYDIICNCQKLLHRKIQKVPE